MGNQIYTIGREFGSAGYEVGRLLAERLGVKLYDKNLLAQAAKDSGFCEEIFENHDEKPTNSFLYSLVMDTYSGGNYSSAPFLDMPLNHKVFLAQFDTIKKIAERESCVIVGRCADYALASNPEDVYKRQQQQNSIMAIGSGQLWGKGLNNSVATSMKNANYIIEPQTDFIFAVAGEELGFVGTIIIILLLLFIVIECILIGRKAKDMSGRLICCGMAALVGFQSIFNIFVATGLMPNTEMCIRDRLKSVRSSSCSLKANIVQRMYCFVRNHLLTLLD